MILPPKQGMKCPNWTRSRFIRGRDAFVKRTGNASRKRLELKALSFQLWQQFAQSLSGTIQNAMKEDDSEAFLCGRLANILLFSLHLIS